MSVTVSTELGEGPIGVRISVDKEHLSCCEAELIFYGIKECAVKPENGLFIIDFHKVKTVDPESLKPILQAYGYAKGLNCNISLVNCRKLVSEFVHQVNLHKLVPVKEFEYLD